MIGCFVLRSLCCPRPTRRHGETTTQGLVGALVGDVREARRYGMMVVLMLSRSTRMRRSGFLALALRLSTRPAPPRASASASAASKTHFRFFPLELPYSIRTTHHCNASCHPVFAASACIV